MKYMYVIAPAASDPLFGEKTAIVNQAAADKAIKAYYPLEDASSDFDVASALAKLRGAEFVLADLSFERPSCYYEVGLAQAVGQDVVLIASADTPIHQADGRVNTWFYQDLDEYKRLIVMAIEQLIAA